jgi:putative membrane protein insertion efficiency factor
MRRRSWALVAVALVALAAADLSRAPADQFGGRAALAGIHLYQVTVSRAFAASGMACRFSPTCSHYAEACISRFGLLRGGRLALQRIVRCGPWTRAGTVDPPPEA